MKINLYDFDKTIYKHDSSTDFFFYCLKKNPKIILLIPKIIVSAIKYKLKIITKTEMKETIFSFVKYIKDIDSVIESFWNKHRKYIKTFYLNKNHDKDIIISASPEFLLNSICKELKVLDLIGSKVSKENGKFNGLNCYGEEKVKRLKQQYSSFEVMESYSDSLSDLPILKLAKKSYLVKNEKLIEKNFKN